MAFHDCASIAIRHRRSVAASNLRTCKRSRLVPRRSAFVATEQDSARRATKAFCDPPSHRALIDLKTDAAKPPRLARKPSSRRIPCALRERRSPTPATRRGSACQPPWRSHHNATSWNRRRDAYKARRCNVGFGRIPQELGPGSRPPGPKSIFVQFSNSEKTGQSISV